MDCIAMVAKSQTRLSDFHFHLIWLEMGKQTNGGVDILFFLS